MSARGPASHGAVQRNIRFQSAGGVGAAATFGHHRFETDIERVTARSLHAGRQIAHGRRPQSPDPRSTSDKGIDRFAFFSGRSGVGCYAGDKTSPSRGSRERPSRPLAAQSRQCARICARLRVPYVCEFLPMLYRAGPLLAVLWASPHSHENSDYLIAQGSTQRGMRPVEGDALAVLLRMITVQPVLFASSKSA